MVRSSKHYFYNLFFEHKLKKQVESQLVVKLEVHDSEGYTASLKLKQKHCQLSYNKTLQRCVKSLIYNWVIVETGAQQ